MAGKKWLETEINFIQNNYKNMTCREMAIQLGRSERAVEHQSAKLNLIREPNINDKLGRLTIKKKIFDELKRKTYVICDCECGNETKQRLTDLVQGRIVSCGCWKAEKARERITEMNFIHGKGDLNYRLFRIWSAMKTRCYNQKHKSYEWYGGRGIIICDNWLTSFENFENWSLSNGYQDDLSIDRIDVNGNYEPSNCRWVDSLTQANNRRNNRLDTVKVTAFGETKAIRSWLNDSRCNVKYMTTIVYRIGAGWTPEDAISKPSERR